MRCEGSSRPFSRFGATSDEEQVAIAEEGVCLFRGATHSDLLLLRVYLAWPPYRIASLLSGDAEGTLQGMEYFVAQPMPQESAASPAA